MEKRLKIIFITTIIFSALLANFVFWSGFSLGFFLTILIAEILIFLLLPKPSRKNSFIFSLIFGIFTLGLSLTFLLYSDYLLQFINFIVLVLLLLMQLLIHSEAISWDWDSPNFFIELIVSPFVRPFRFLPKVKDTFKTFKKIDEQLSENSTSTPRKHLGGNILLGFLAAVPALVVVIVLLSSADKVFSSYFKSIIYFVKNLNLGELAFTIIFTAIIFPFLFSFIYSYATKWKENSSGSIVLNAENKAFKINPVIASTFLFCMNIVYGVFTWVQFSSLFGAFSNYLPPGISYAEYARNGFFQLSFVACINVLIVIIGVMATSRESKAGIIVRILSVLMIAFTYVLLISAAYRMKMYVLEFALTKMRLLVSIFMVLIAAVLFYVLIKEFFIKFKFLKFTFITAIIILLFTNFYNPSARIAEYNTKTFIGNGHYAIDTSYLVFDLSFDAVPVLIKIVKSENYTYKKRIESELLDIYNTHLRYYRKDNWKNYNLSKENAKKEIEDYFGIGYFK